VNGGIKRSCVERELRWYVARGATEQELPGRGAAAKYAGNIARYQRIKSKNRILMAR
jgi:hypothetical protein